PHRQASQGGTGAAPSWRSTLHLCRHYEIDAAPGLATAHRPRRRPRHANRLATRSNQALAACGLTGVISDFRKERWRYHEWFTGNRIQAKAAQKFRQRNGIEALQPAAGPGQQTEQGFWHYAGRTQRGQACVAVPFGQPPAIEANNERNVRKPRRLILQGPVEQELPRSGCNQVVPANDFGDLLLRIIDDDRKLVCRRGRRFPDHEIAALMAKIDAHLTMETIVEFGGIRYTEAPAKWVVRNVFRILDFSACTGAGIDWPFLLSVRCAGGSVN